MASSSGKVDATARLAVLKTRLFRAVCRRVCKGLLNKDRLLFALRLAQVSIPHRDTCSAWRRSTWLILRGSRVRVFTLKRLDVLHVLGSFWEKYVL